MSGDDDDTPTASLDCPTCGSAVFERDAPGLWYEDEDEHCEGCGALVLVALDRKESDADEEDTLTARAYVSEERFEAPGVAPAAHFGMKLHSLDCPDCSNEVFAREADLFGDGESEHCPGCGSLVTISTDEESPLDVRVDEHGGAVVARLLAEVERLTEESKQRLACVGEYSALTDELTRELDVERSKVEQLTTKRDALEGLFAAAMVDDREAEHRAEVQDARRAVRLARIDRAGAQSPARARAIIAAWVREGEAGNNIDEASGVCLDGVDLEAIHRGGS